MAVLVQGVILSCLPAIAALLSTYVLAAQVQNPDVREEPFKDELVMIVGCAHRSNEPEVWVLGEAGTAMASPNVAITEEDVQNARARPLGIKRYELIGVADFVDAELSRSVGRRSTIWEARRVNTTATLRDGAKVAVKGVYVAGAIPKVNLTSVVELASTCGARQQ